MRIKNRTRCQLHFALQNSTELESMENITDNLTVKQNGKIITPKQLKTVYFDDYNGQWIVYEVEAGVEISFEYDPERIALTVGYDHPPLNGMIVNTSLFGRIQYYAPDEEGVI